MYRIGSLETTFACEVCGTPAVPREARQRTCGASGCVDRVRYLTKLRDPKQIVERRRQNAEWARVHRGCRRELPWLKGVPPYGTHMPGGGVELSVSPYPRWPVELRNTRALHGMITSLVGGHSGRWPRWSLVPWPCTFGWGVYLWEDDVANRLAGATFGASLYDRPVMVTTSPLRRIRAPTVRKRGHQRLRIDAVTPVVIVSEGRRQPHQFGTAKSICDAVGGEFVRRLGVIGVKRDWLMVEEVESDTHPCRTQLGGKYGAVTGWTGHMVLECNAPAAWLLKCAGLVGLGTRTAFGFGRVRVSDVCS